MVYVNFSKIRWNNIVQDGFRKIWRAGTAWPRGGCPRPHSPVCGPGRPDGRTVGLLLIVLIFRVHKDPVRRRNNNQKIHCEWQSCGARLETFASTRARRSSPKFIMARAMDPMLDEVAGWTSTTKGFCGASKRTHPSIVRTFEKPRDGNHFLI